MTNEIGKVNKQAEVLDVKKQELSAFERYYTRQRVVSKNNGISKTQVSFADECDIHNIVAKYSPDGINLISMNNLQSAEYGDYDMNKSAYDHINAFTKVKDYFENLPFSVRKEFGHDLQTFLEESQNPDKIDKFCKLGIYERKTTDEFGSVSVIDKLGKVISEQLSKDRIDFDKQNMSNLSDVKN